MYENVRPTQFILAMKCVRKLNHASMSEKLTVICQYTYNSQSII